MLSSYGRFLWLAALALAAGGRASGQVTLLDTLGTSGTGNGQFNQPLGLAVGPDGRLFVADSANNRVQVFAQVPTSVSFAYTSQFGSSGAGNAQFSFPTDVAVGPTGTAYVADSFNNRVQFFNAAGAYQGQFGGTGTANGRFDAPSGLTVAPDGAVLVADAGNNRVQVFSATGAYQSQFANAGPAPQTVSQPAGVAASAGGVRYVADTSGNRIQAYNADGSFRATFGSGLLSAPTDLSVAASGNVYVADSGNGVVRVFGRDGAFQFNLPTGALNNPSDVAVAPTGQIFVSDTLNNRVVRLFNPAEWVSGFNTFTAPVAGSGQLLGTSLALNPGMTLNSLSALTVQGGAAVVVNGGALNSTGTASVAGTLTVRAGSTATSTGLVTVQAGGLLNGNGTLVAPVSVGGTIRPGEAGGAAVATLRTGNLTLAPGGTYEWTVARATGVAGADWSLLAQAGANSLTITSTPASRFTIRVSSAGALADFDPARSYSFAIASYDSAAGFAPDRFAVDTSGFANSLGGGTFGVSAQGGALFLNFTPVPEPSLVLVAAALLVAARRLRR